MPDSGDISNSWGSPGSPDPGTWRVKVMGISEVLVSTTSLVVWKPGLKNYNTIFNFGFGT